MSTIGNRIKQRRIDLGLSVDELAKKLNKNRATIYRYESNDIENFSITIIEPLAKLLQTTPAYLMGWTDNPDSISNLVPLRTKKVPFLGDIACGKPIWADSVRGEYVDIDEDIKADFALRAKGDSMVGARINDGDIVFVREQPHVENGEIAVIIIDDEATLKRVYYYHDYISLNPENPDYRPIILKEGDADNIKILGKAVAFQSKL